MALCEPLQVLRLVLESAVQLSTKTQHYALLVGELLKAFPKQAQPMDLPKPGAISVAFQSVCGTQSLFKVAARRTTHIVHLRQDVHKHKPALLILVQLDVC